MLRIINYSDFYLLVIGNHDEALYFFLYLVGQDYSICYNLQRYFDIVSGHVSRIPEMNYESELRRFFNNHPINPDDTNKWPIGSLKRPLCYQYALSSCQPQQDRSK